MNGEVSFHMKERPVEEKDERRFKEKWRRKGDELKYLEARVGDHIVAPFECDLCIFINTVEGTAMRQCEMIRYC